jgi:pimeloyl-ACP methyl ester carboxylesterase
VLSRATREVLGGAAAVVDRAVNLAALSRSGGQRSSERLRHDERLDFLARLAERYQELDASRIFFREPRVIEPDRDLRLDGKDGLRVTDLSWSSDYRTFLPEVHERYTSTPQNRRAHARLVSHEGPPRPVAILIHGYLGGVHRMERRIWPMAFLRRLGLDVALFVLPFHGPRGAPGYLGKAPPFPGADPRITNEGLRQAMGDLRDFISWLVAQGHPEVGVMGMSLGAFNTALATTVEPRLSFAVPIIPLASFPDVIRHQGRLGSTRTEAQEQYAALERVYRITSPLDRPAVIASERIFVVAGMRDQITPVSHAQKLAAHFHCRIETWHGGHLVQVGRSEKFRNIGRFLNEVGVVSRGFG